MGNEGALNGLGSIFRAAGNKDIQPNHDEWFGIGQLMKILSRRAAEIEDKIDCGVEGNNENLRLWVLSQKF